MLGVARIAGIMAAKKHARSDPALPSAGADQGRRSISRRRRPARRARARHRQGHRPDRRRDGGADRRLGRLPHDLRHGEGRRPRHAHRGRPPRREGAAASPATGARKSAARDARADRTRLHAAFEGSSHGRLALAALRPRTSADGAQTFCRHDALARILAPRADADARPSPSRRSAARWRATWPRRARSRRSTSPPWTATRVRAADVATPGKRAAASIGAGAGGARLRGRGQARRGVRIFTGAPRARGRRHDPHPGRRDRREAP